MIQLEVELFAGATVKSSEIRRRRFCFRLGAFNSSGRLYNLIDRRNTLVLVLTEMFIYIMLYLYWNRLTFHKFMINEHSVHNSVASLETKNQPPPENKIVFSDDEHLSENDVE